MALSVVSMGGGRRSAATPEPMRDYYVRIPGMAEVGGKPVQERGGQRIVRLTEAQAQYWLDQGAIAEQPGETRLGAALGRAQAAGVGAPARAQHARPGRRPAARSETGEGA